MARALFAAPVRWGGGARAKSGPVAGGRDGEGIVGEHLAGRGLEPGGDFAQERHAVFLELLVADAADAREIFVAGGVEASHLPQGDIGEDNVGGKVFFIGQPLAQAAELLDTALQQNLAAIKKLPVGELLETRYQKFRNMAQFFQVEA